MGDYVVYVHQNKTDGKRYIGITNNPGRRWCNKGKYYQGCPHFFNAIQRYGWDSFTHEIIESGLTLDEANEREQFYIAKYRTTDKRYGYNATIGGNRAPTMLGKNHSEETKRKIGESQRGRKHSEDQNRRHSECMTGKMVGSKNRTSRAVRCINTGEVFESQRIAAREKGVQQAKICLCCQGKRSHTHGLKWEYVEA